MLIENKIIEEYNNNFSEKAIKIKPITQAGSNRKYYRIITEKSSVVAVYSENIRETETFLYYTETFLSLKLNVPQIYYVSNNKKIYIIEDFGDVSLLDVVKNEYEKHGKFSKYLVGLYEKSIDALADMQIKSAKLIDFSRAYSISEFDKQSILFDLNYFKYYFVNLNNISCNEKKLQDDFDSFAEFLSNHGEKYFMFRDFQSRNIMIKNSKPYFIDYQGGRRGAIQYDMASLLYQAKAQIPEDVKQQLFEHYMEKIKNFIEINENEFVNQFYYYVYIRVLQTLGTYGFRGLIEKRTHFLESVPFGLQNLRNLLVQRPLLAKYEELNRVLTLVVGLTKFEQPKPENLTIKVTSFSFKKAYPDDYSGNGGGFVFDCRGILNPGRYDEYKTKTGRDSEVIDFFEIKTDIHTYLQNVIALIKPTIDNYIDRDFKNLSVSFGCTGGQHRSVYSAEFFVNFLRENYPTLNVNLEHRELGIFEKY
ncbi:phosphotransferase [Bacteroidales bacterium OttesenSCG-928-I21]|nr:phosphotransferase [Bacteroidales bacterium OttesenSCG-928-I21]